MAALTIACASAHRARAGRSGGAGRLCLSLTAVARLVRDARSLATIAPGPWTWRAHPGPRSTAIGSPSTRSVTSRGAPRPTSPRAGRPAPSTSADLEGVDLIASYWMGDAIAHVMVSFAFRTRQRWRSRSRPARRWASPTRPCSASFAATSWSMSSADERDLIGVRTNVRADPPEDVYLYRVAMPKENARRLFLEYIRDMNDLREQPQFYNTATTNCTTMVLINNRVNGSVSLLNWKILLSGYLPQLAYERGRLDQSLPFPELRQRSRVNDAAQAAGLDAPDFSARIRDRPAAAPSRLPSRAPHRMTSARRASEIPRNALDDRRSRHACGADRPRSHRGQPATRAGLCRRARAEAAAAHQDPQDPRARPPPVGAGRRRHHLPEARRGRGHGGRGHRRHPAHLQSARPRQDAAAGGAGTPRPALGDARQRRGRERARRRDARGRARAAGADRVRHRRRALRRADARRGGRAGATARLASRACASRG